jgi:hypothetical protein
MYHSDPLLWFKFKTEVGYQRGVPQKSAHIIRGLVMLYITEKEKKNITKKQLFLNFLFVFFICLVLEHPIYMSNINRIFKTLRKDCFIFLSFCGSLWIQGTKQPVYVNQLRQRTGFF